jgi:hypothetical protein
LARRRDGRLQVHVYPLEDTRAHELRPGCWCRPSREEVADGVMYGHNSADGRELVEEHGVQ